MSESITLNVPDISCNHCKTSIEGAVGSLDSVSSVEVSIAERTVAIDFIDAADLVGVATAIEDQGYDVPAQN